MGSGSTGKGKTILVTGGAGYIGSHIVATLLDQNYKVIVADDFSSGSRAALHAIAELCRCELSQIESSVTEEDLVFLKTGKGRFFFSQTKCSNRELIGKIFACFDIYGVIHLAGLKSVTDSVSEPLHYYSENIFESVCLLKQMEKYNCRNFIFSSSASVYGDAAGAPVSEGDPVAPISPYAKTKYIIEQICADLAASDSKWRCVALRYFNPVGAHDSLMIGENLRVNPPNLMPVLMTAALGESPSVKIFGSDYDTKDGTAVRDYIHVMDLAEGHVCALENNRFGFDVFNLGTGIGYSVRELVDSFSQATDVQFEIQYQERRAGDVSMSIANIDKARVDLGWTAKRGVVSMCRSAFLWAKRQKQGLR